MKVTIDSGSGFCGGVIRAIDTIEGLLAEGRTLYSLGEPVHNEEELARLSSLGLRVLDKAAFPDGVPAGAGLVIRAHGEPPETYRLAAGKGAGVVDCTCPVVLGLQGKIRRARGRLGGGRGRIVIFGKKGHPEVLGLVGNAGPEALVVETPDAVKAAVAEGKIKAGEPLEVFSQTTMDPEAYGETCRALIEAAGGPGLVTVHDTVCRQVASRRTELSSFASANDVIVFVSGRSSSNGKVLYELCRSVNPRTHWIGGPSELEAGWFPEGCSVGVCGATSTPRWLLEKVAAGIENLQ